jgi:DNA-binding NarL/FixJ family response regulator
LTGREQAVADLLRQGFSNREIASALSISHDTARRHSSKVHQKLKLGSAAALPLAASKIDPETLRTMPILARVFSPAELKVLALVCKGMSTKSIARELEVTPRTIDKHRQRLLSKSGQRSARALTAWVAEQYVVCGIARIQT